MLRRILIWVALSFAALCIAVIALLMYPPDVYEMLIGFTTGRLSTVQWPLLVIAGALLLAAKSGIAPNQRLSEIPDEPSPLSELSSPSAYSFASSPLLERNAYTLELAPPNRVARKAAFHEPLSTDDRSSVHEYMNDAGGILRRLLDRRAIDDARGIEP